MQEKSRQSKMSKKPSVASRRAWTVLRLALLWSRKGGLFRNRLQLSLNVLGKGIRKLRHSSDQTRGALVYGEHELSFDDTPIIHVNMHRPSSLRFKMPHIPCINPHVDFEYDFDDDVADEDFEKFVDKVKVEEKEEQVRRDCDEGIDLKAEEFIAKFYEQIKLQRQISYLQYTEKLNRGNT